MLILAFETSCDETSAALVHNGTEVLSLVTTSSQDVFAKAGGVIPEEAARMQVEAILPILHRCLEDATMEPNSVDAIAVTKGPGLLGSLIVGTTCARTVASLWQKPLIGVHHTLGHLSSVWTGCTDPIAFPILTLSASGGHTDIWYRTSHTSGELLGRTLDDAAGEAFDKGAAMLGLPYPGGPSIAKAAENGDRNAYEFPLPLRGDGSFNFSFSGLKTALKYTLRDHSDVLGRLNDICASYQEGICTHLVDRINNAIEAKPSAKEIHLVGGVSANIRLREMITEQCSPLSVRYPCTIAYCTDNAAMIASAAYFLHEEKGDQAYASFDTEASLPLAALLAH